MRGGVRSPKITALETHVVGSHLSVTPQLSAEPPPSCTGAGGGTLGSSEVELVVEGDEEARGAETPLRAGMPPSTLGWAAAGRNSPSAQGGFPWVLLGSPGRRIVYSVDASKVKAFKLCSVWTQAVKKVRKELKVTGFAALSGKLPEKRATFVRTKAALPKPLQVG